MLDFARIWQAADKIVYSKSLETVVTPKMRLKGEFDPQAVRDLKTQLPDNLSVGAKLDLMDERRFANGMVYLRYTARL